MSRGRIHSLVRSGFRVGLVSVDQALSSLSNFAASIIAAHSLPTESFGAFGIIFATYMMAIYSVRAITGEVILLIGAERARADGATNLLVSAAAGLCIGALIFAAGCIVDGPLSAAFVVLAAGMAGLAVQDTIRYLGFASQRVHFALIVDILWLVFMLAACWFFLTSDAESLTTVTGAWVGSGVAAALVTLPFLKIGKPSASRVRNWLRDQKATMLSLFVDRGIVSATQQSVVYIIAVTIGLEGNAAYRGAQIVIGPFSVIAMGFATVMIPHFVKIWQREPAALLGQAARISILSGGSLLLLTQLVAGIPDGLGRALLDQSWALGKPILRAMALIVPLQIANFAALGALRAMGRVGMALWVRVIVTPLTLISVVTAAYLGDIGTVVWAQVVGAAVASLLWWFVAWRAHLGHSETLEGAKESAG